MFYHLKNSCYGQGKNFAEQRPNETIFETFVPQKFSANLSWFSNKIKNYESKFVIAIEDLVYKTKFELYVNGVPTWFKVWDWNNFYFLPQRYMSLKDGYIAMPVKFWNEDQHQFHYLKYKMPYYKHGDYEDNSDNCRKEAEGFCVLFSYFIDTTRGAIVRDPENEKRMKSTYDIEIEEISKSEYERITDPTTAP